jgi:hypothetical protein
MSFPPPPETVFILVNIVYFVPAMSKVERASQETNYFFWQKPLLSIATAPSFTKAQESIELLCDDCDDETGFLAGSIRNSRGSIAHRARCSVCLSIDATDSRRDRKVRSRDEV